MNDTDWQKLGKQEPEFADYCKNILWESIAMQQPDYIKAIYSFYQIGMTAEQVVNWMELNQKFGKL